MKTILIVDDDLATRDALKELLKTYGHKIVTACDGQDAIEWLRSSERPSLILLDLSMPRMDGWEFLRHKAIDPLMAAIPTIVLSGSTLDLPEDVRDLLLKPADPGRLIALVNQYC